MKGKQEHTWVGPAVFLITLAAVLVFFWWLVVYDHGVPPGH